MCIRDRLFWQRHPCRLVQEKGLAELGTALPIVRRDADRRARGDNVYERQRRGSAVGCGDVSFYDDYDLFSDNAHDVRGRRGRARAFPAQFHHFSLLFYRSVVHRRGSRFVSRERRAFFSGRLSVEPCRRRHL